MQQTVCAALCRYYKPQRDEEERCGGYNWLAAHPQWQVHLAGLDSSQPGRLFGLEGQDPRLWAVCKACPFLIDGCDFRDPSVADADCAPCGGLRAIAGLLAAGLALEI